MIDIKFHEGMYELFYERFHKDKRYNEIPITRWMLQIYGGEYIFVHAGQSVIRFENDADATIFKLTFRI